MLIEMNPALLETEYNNRARVPEHPAIIAGWAADAASYRSAHPPRRITYGAGPRHTVDVFAPASPRPDRRPVLFIHGGYWQGLDPSFFSHLAQGANAHGLTVGVAGYDLCPDVTVGDIVRQMRQAAVAFAGHCGVSEIVVSGHSAGGHLAACLAATDWRALGQERPLVTAGLALSGLFDLEPLVPTSVNAKLGLSPEEARAQSPRLMTPAVGLVFDCIVGGAESGEYHRQSRTLAAVWAGHGARMTFAEVEGADHFTVVAGLAHADDRLTRRLVALATG
jgi:arylformamidase